MKSSINFLKFYALLSTAAIVYLFYQSNQPAVQQDVLRVKGIVIEDEQGRERILMGAPIPFAQNRVRTDTARARDSWGFIHEDYMEFYKSYDHHTNGILILDENGYDRLAMGDPTPDPNIGKRIGPSTGFVINDKEGFERSGYGLLTVNGIDRVNLGLDTNSGTEGLVLSVEDNGTHGLIMKGPEHTIFLGKSDSTNYFRKEQTPFSGLIMRAENGQDLEWNTKEIPQD